MKVHSRRLAQHRHTQPFAIDACISNFYDIQDVQEKNVPFSISTPISKQMEQFMTRLEKKAGNNLAFQK